MNALGDLVKTSPKTRGSISRRIVVLIEIGKTVHARGKLLAVGSGPPLSLENQISELLYRPVSLNVAVRFPTASSSAVTMPWWTRRACVLIVLA